MENLNNTPYESMTINKEGVNYLFSTTKWTKFLAIVLFVCTALMILAGISMMVSGAAMSAMLQSNPAFAMLGGAAIGMVYIVSAAFYFLFGYLLWNFSVKTRKAIELNNEDALATGLRSLKTYFKANGIILIVALAMIAFSLLMVGCAAAMAM